MQPRALPDLRADALTTTLICLLALGFPSQSPAQAVAANAHGLAELSLEELGEMPVTSVTGRPESLRSAPASVFVISGEDIRRSGANSLPEALRLAPNLQVARLSSGQYAISARGFNNAIANKLLVLIDGRTIYSSLFSGVFWDFHDLVLEDIDRIEVISGPGGTLWGANAVNGIVNVITKPAGATQGGLVSVTRSGHGGQESARWGGRLGEVGHVRLYALATDRGSTRTAAGVDVNDSSSKKQVGFRSDLTLQPGLLTMQGDAFSGGDDPANNFAPKMYGGNLLARWESRLADGSPYRVQAYYDLQARDDVNLFRNRTGSWDLQFTHEPIMPKGHQLLWGGGYRVADDENKPNPLIGFNPAERRLTWANVFAQHQVQLEQWQLTVGAKAERNTYTGVEFLPSVRIAYQHENRGTTWGGLSRTVRAPARIDRDFFFPANPPFVIAGGEGFESEVANVLEIGHRGQMGRDVSYSATVFRQRYEGLRAGRGTPLRIANRIEGDVDGLEAWAQWQPAGFARLTLGYLGLRKDLRFSEPPADSTSIPNLGNDPRNQWTLRAQFDLPRRTELDFFVRRVGALPDPAVPSYTSVDARLGWQLAPALEVSLIVQNLGDRQHREFGTAASASTFGRRVLLRMIWQP
ncbi:MAG TPA: TonB-dependent receptor [Vicinamibacterales bacterium]|nr:TonB-dependent receptor [Vicinamibacterales bacterium]